MLFKAEDRGTGEDWAEKIACELCRRLGVPHVHYELAAENGSGTPGVVCESCVPPGMELALGNELLLAADPHYPAHGRRYEVRAHTVAAVAEALDVLKPPPPAWCADLPQAATTALDVFVGYLMMDAWTANQDRHHENWAALKSGGAWH